MKTVSVCTSGVWERICSKVNRAVVFIDNPCAEILHWHGGLNRLVQAGATNVKEFSSFESADDSQKKAMFIVSMPLLGVTLDILRDIVQASSFQYVVIITSSSPQIHTFCQSGSLEGDETSVFEMYEDRVLEWMRNMNYTVEITHMPTFCASISKDLFITPGYSDLFPLLSSDLGRIRAQHLSSTGERRNFESLREVELTHLPKNLQILYKMFVGQLNSLLADLGVQEDCYYIGQTSRILATELANFPPARNRRKSTQAKASLLLLDRTMDMTAVCNHQSETLLDKIVSMLPRLPSHNNDILVDMSSLCNVHKDASSAILPGCLASTATDGGVQSHLSSFTSSKQKEALMDVNRQLVEATSRENLPLSLTGKPGRITADSLESIVSLFKGNYTAITNHLDILQLAMATHQYLKHPMYSCHDNLCKEEKLLLQNIGLSDSASPLSQIQNLLLQTNENGRAYSLDEILILLVNVYSMIGDELCGTDEEAQLKMVEASDLCRTQILQFQAYSNDQWNFMYHRIHYEAKFVVEIIKEKNNLPPVVEMIVGSVVTLEVVTTIVDDLWTRLEAIGDARESLTQLGSTVDQGSVLSLTSYKPFLRQMIDLIFDPSKPEIKDIELKTSGFTDLLKSGFGLFRSVTSKPRPSDHPLLIVFVIGGITSTELKQVKEVLAKHQPNTKVIFGSTQLVKQEDVIKYVFCQDNVNPQLPGM